MNPAAGSADAETLAEALRVLSGRWSIASTPAVVSALIPLALGSLATARLALAEGIPPTSFRAEMRLARAVVDSSGVFLAPESVSAARTSDEPWLEAQEPLWPPEGVSGRQGLDSPDRGAIVGGRVVAEDGGRP